MKARVRQEFPLLARDVRSKLRQLGWKRTQVKHQMRDADYVSPTGRVKRFKKRDLPKPPQPQCCIVGDQASGKDALRVINLDKFRPALYGTSRNRMRFCGSGDECREILQTAIKQWWSLPRGTEIEHVAAARVEFKTEAAS